MSPTTAGANEVRRVTGHRTGAIWQIVGRVAPGGGRMTVLATAGDTHRTMIGRRGMAGLTGTEDLVMVDGESHPGVGTMTGIANRRGTDVGGRRGVTISA